MRIINILLFLTFSIVSYSNNFSAYVQEKSYINGVEKVKKYKIDYLKEKLIINVIEPNINKGEVYTYTNKTKTSYYPKLNQLITEDINEDEVNLFNVLQKILKDKKDIRTIQENNYTIYLDNYINHKPQKISFIDNDNYIIYELEYDATH